MILKKNILQVHVRKKKFPAQDYCSKKIHARTVGWEKNSDKMFPGLTHRTLPIKLGKRDSLHNDVFPSDGLFFTFIAPVQWLPILIHVF